MELSGISYGVLNCKDTPNPRKFPYIVDADLLSLLKDLLAHTGAKIVLSSSWRTDPVGLLAAKYYGIPFVDVCPDLPEVSRCEEMLRWLSAHQEVHRYVVIDDESDCLDDLPLFQPSSSTGLTVKIVEGVEKYLAGNTDDVLTFVGNRANPLQFSCYSLAVLELRPEQRIHNERAYHTTSDNIGVGRPGCPSGSVVAGCGEALSAGSGHCSRR